MDLLIPVESWREIVCVGHQFLTIPAGAVGLTVPPTAQAAALEYEGGHVAIRLDGGTPNPVTDPIRMDRDRDFLTRVALLNWRSLRVGAAAGDGAVRVSYFCWQR